jgi:hypothetical protein
MTFASAQDETRERFTETLTLLNHIRQQSPEGFTPLDNIQKSMRGLWLVSLYAAFERSTNAIVEAAIMEVASHGSRSIDCAPEIQSLIHYSKIQSVKDCGANSVFDKSVILFRAVFSGAPLSTFDNPLAERMQNVDGGTLLWVARLFGLESLSIAPDDRGRLNMLRERRNAVAHGRESASDVGERYTLNEMNNLYTAADRASTAFLFAMKEHCIDKLYLRAA